MRSDMGHIVHISYIYFFICFLYFSYLQESNKEKEKQEEMMKELKTLTENIGLTFHVKALMKETFIRRKEIIDMSDTISTVVSNFPFLLKAEIIHFLV